MDKSVNTVKAPLSRRHLIKLIGGVGAAAAFGGIIGASDEIAAAGGGSLQTTSSLNLRSGPGTDRRVLLVMPKRTHVFDHGKTRNGFRLVTYANTRGWAFDQYLQASTQIPGEAGPVIGTGMTTTSVNFRSGPSTGDDVIRVLAKGSPIELTDTIVDGFRFVYDQGNGGWIFDDYLTLGGDNSGGTLTVTTDLNLRAEPNTSARILAMMPKGSSVQRSDLGVTGFGYVGYKGTWGWAWMDYLR